ncbi:MAG: glycoside hydrolase family 18 protein [Patescibacteria group bacterium]|nr:glycoside hydrolase family 18 protein [Patescibacteria group bacterium]
MPKDIQQIQTNAPIIAKEKPSQPSQPVNPTKQESLKREVFGFLPYWKLDQASNLHYNLLSTIAYFGVTADDNGGIVEEDPGFTGWVSPTMETVRQKARENNVRIVLTLEAMTNNRIENILNDPATRTRLINRTVAEVNSKGGGGINLDFEYVGDPGPIVRKEFTDFTKEMADALHREIPGSEISVDVYAGGSHPSTLYDVSALTPSIDKIFIMGYDFYSPGSDNAGPVAPLYGAQEGKYYLDVATAVDEFLKVAPAEKIILGVPYYGWDWPVYDGKDPRSAKSWGGTEMKTYALTQEDSDNNDGSRNWDDLAKEPWYWWWNPTNETWHQVWYEDAASLGFKYDFINQKNLGGAGIWALGYDQNRPELWDLLKNKFFG